MHMLRRLHPLVLARPLVLGPLGVRAELVLICQDLVVLREE